MASRSDWTSGQSKTLKKESKLLTRAFQITYFILIWVYRWIFQKKIVNFGLWKSTVQGPIQPSYELDSGQRHTSIFCFTKTNRRFNTADSWQISTATRYLPHSRFLIYIQYSVAAKLHNQCNYIKSTYLSTELNLDDVHAEKYVKWRWREAEDPR